MAVIICSMMQFVSLSVCLLETSVKEFRKLLNASKILLQQVLDDIKEFPPEYLSLFVQLIEPFIHR